MIRKKAHKKLRGFCEIQKSDVTCELPYNQLTYCRIKALKKILGLEGLSLYMVKKQLMRPAFLRLESECDSNLGDFFYFVLSQPELKDSRCLTKSGPEINHVI